MKNFQNNIQNAVFKLTDREIKCLMLAAEDKSLIDTAQNMHVATVTVKKYRATILRKLGCQTMVGALGIAIKHKFVHYH